MPAPPPDRLRDHLMVVLAVTSGATDAIGILALGNTFTSVMTGNLVLVGVGMGNGDLDAIGRAAAAILAFVAGAGLGARITGTHTPGDPTWPPAITKALAVEACLLGVFAVCWWALGSDPPDETLHGLLVLNAGAMGLQSGAILRFGVPGLSTTYLTGMLTTVIVRFTHRRRLDEIAASLRILVGVVVGAAIGGLLVKHQPVAVPLVQLITLLGVIAVAVTARSLRSGPERDATV